MALEWVIRKICPWKKKLMRLYNNGRCAGLFIVGLGLCIIIAFLVSKGLYNCISVSKFSNESFQALLLNKQSKIILLESLLRRYAVPEEEYRDERINTIYVITPTYSRLEQKAELTRLKNVLLHIPSLHWIIIEDSKEPTTLVSNFLKFSMVSYTHLFLETPQKWKLSENEPRWRKPRGILQRNGGLKWLRENTKPTDKGVLYFADDDNTYSIELFEEIRNTQGVSVWPVGLAGGVRIELPKVNSQGKVVGWIAGWRSDRHFATDMAGFAINLSLLLDHPDVYFSFNSRVGFMETDFLEHFVEMQDLEPKADLCSKVLVWHTQTKAPVLKEEGKLKEEWQAIIRQIEV